MNDWALRKRITQIAREWLGTPYHIMARRKGIGCDCLTLLVEVYKEADVIPYIEVPYYPQDWHLHRESERYLNGITQYTVPVIRPLPGDIALWRFGRCYSHGAIVIEWPIIIHAYVGRACVMENAEAAIWLSHIGENEKNKGKKRPVKFFSAVKKFESN